MNPAYLKGHWALGLLALLLAGRLIVGALVPLAPDEAYYALWARTLSAGYFDHPPMIAFFIRAGTTLLGETPLGVRLACILAALPASWFVWRATAMLVTDRAAAPLATLFFNLTLIGYFGMVVATPDVPLILFAAAMLYFAARLLESDSLGLWIAMGVATGLAFEAKYSAALIAAGFSLAVLLVAPWRRQLPRPGPWLALATAILVFAPNIAWNASNDWATFLKQGGRVTREAGLAPGYLVEFFGAQLGLATPFIFVLGAIGLLPSSAEAYRSSWARRLLLCFILVPTAYFLVHALRARVEGNWPGFLYPALAVVAAAAAGVSGGRLRAWLARAAMPTALAIALIGTAYVVVGPVTAFGRKDPILRMTHGWNALAAEVRALAAKTDARYILTTDYQLNAELSWLLPEMPVAQVNERERYAMLNGPRPERFGGTGLLLLRSELPSDFSVPFARFELLGSVYQRQGDVVITRFFAYRVELPASSP